MKARKVITGALLLLVTAAAASAVLSPAIRRAPATIEERAEKALRYAGRKGLNVNYCLLLDYGIESGKPRLFVWSFKERRVVYSAHAMHGPGKGSTAVTPVIVTTNLDGNGIRARYGERILSRLLETFAWLPFKGGDKREKKARVY